MQLIQKEDMDYIAIGAAVLGSGGGGDPLLGKLMAKQAIAEMGPVRLLQAEDLPDDATVIPSAMMGAPAAHAMMMSLLHWLTQTAVSLPGGVLYALRRDHVTRREMEETIEQEENDLAPAAADEP